VSFGGVEALLVPWLASTLSRRVVTETPSDLQNVVPLHRVVSFGGTAYPKVPKLISPRVALTTFAVGYKDAAQEAENAKRAMLSLLPGVTIAGSTVTGVSLLAGPTWVPYTDTVLRQFTTTFDLVIQTA
jgi:hypothetical protein